ncbi:MAG: pyrimidine dimer DNA glycosylase [Candidatus Omnitrophica bacterium]|nr:pyrimidine dimer DNA glycosylase [Candidatus Omnitrophota bacterium]
MRIWDIGPDKLCRNHLLGEHRELHAIWSVLTKNKKGYSRHPETLRWKGKLAALYLRHGKLVAEMVSRGYRHNSPLERRLARGDRKQTLFVASRRKQVEILRNKGCECRVRGTAPIS